MHSHVIEVVGTLMTPWGNWTLDAVENGRPLDNVMGKLVALNGAIKILDPLDYDIYIYIYI